MNKIVSYFWRYIASTLFAVLFYVLATLVLKISLVTVQGPTLVSRIIETVVFYFALIAAIIFLFSSFEKKKHIVKTWQLFLYPAIISLLHIIIVLVVSTQTLYIIPTGVNIFAELLYVGGGQLNSSMEMPRIYYVIAVIVQCICFIGFSVLGIYISKRRHCKKPKAGSSL